MERSSSKELSIKEIIIKLQHGIVYVKTKLFLILILGIIGAGLGVVYAFLKKTTYTATCTFVLDDGSKSSMLSQYAGLASLAGVDVSGGADGGLFQGDNILELYKSRKMIEKTLLSKSNFNGHSQMLIERYISFNGLREGWKKNHLDQINFVGDPQQFNRQKDSIITDIVGLFNKKFLSVDKPDKKLSIIKVTFVNNDEIFSQIFTELLVNNVNKFYVQTKTQKSEENVQLLTFQKDSVQRLLNSSLSGVASAIDATPNANPQMLSLKVPSQKKQVDVQATSAVYAEIIKNLELAKVTLMQDKPLVQVIDSPVLPLEKNKVSKVMALIVGFILASILTIVWLVAKKVYYKIMA